LIKSLIFICPIAYRPNGGVGFIYRIVDFLNDGNISAYVYHIVKGYQCDWINHGGHIHTGSLIPKYHHIILPENSVLEYADFLLKNNFEYSILVQNGYYIPDRINSNNIDECNELSIYYRKANFIFSVSDYTTKLINSFFGNNLVIIKLLTTPYLINTYIPHSKKKIISYMSRKNSINTNRVIFGLNELRSLGWKIIDINSNGSMSESNLVTILSESAIFLSFGIEEGMPAPPLEAANFGCIVIGYHGYGGLEYWNQNPFHIITQGDIVSFIIKVKQICLDYDFNVVPTNFYNKFTYINSKLSVINSFNSIEPKFSSSNKDFYIQISMIKYKFIKIIMYLFKKLIFLKIKLKFL